MIKYIDCDGVILDTETHLFDEYNRLKEMGIVLKRSEYLSVIDWEEILANVNVLNNAINLLKGYNPKGVNILTKIHSLKEAKAKINYFRKVGVKNPIVFVTANFKKSEVASSAGNILVDDNLANLDDWNLANGIPIHFSNEVISTYPTVNSLESILDDTILEMEEVKLLSKRNID